ncbi:hypothetical protein WJX84_010149 [Apatococcus fuscideae]|uniref:FAD/NAD(P)-binding domain-containing protein n=1 Tax=Apatococcus fuscideae TaxID=2026836 RepID=A0AAW1TB62_9CHLO
MAKGHDYDFDLVTLGAGSGGTRASRFSAQKYGAKVACVELPFGFISSDQVGGAGGTCVIRGCVPKKLLVYGSAFAEEFSDAGGFGWKASKPDFDWTHLMSKKTKEIERLNGVYNKLLANAGVELIEGRGSLRDAHTVEVALSSGGIRTLTADKILLAIGGKPVKAPIEGSEHAITSDEVLALPDLPTPRRIVAVGAGYIAIEFASMFNGFGVDMHLMYRKDLPLAGFDGECRQRVAENLQQRGLHLYPKTSPTKIVKQSNGSFSVTYKGDTGESTLDDVGLVVFGTGRSPNTKDIGLEAAGVRTEKDGTIIVDEYSKTSAANIYALGDVTNRLNLTPVAIMEGMAFAATAFGGVPTKPIHERVEPTSAPPPPPPLGASIRA